MAAFGNVSSDRLSQYMIVGELSLDGRLQPIRGALPISIRARTEKFKGLIVPVQNVCKAAVVNNLDVYGMESLSEVVRFLNGDDSFQPTVIDTRKEFFAHQSQFDLDFSDVRGQEPVKRALEVAAAGGHNIIMIGPPGSGKSMIAKRLPSILPPLSLSESLETTQIHSVAGKLNRDSGLISQRPYRAPHHTISQVALVGGGNPQPGEISLAHNGVLFMDELPEFQRSVLEVMRQPLEDRHITVSRAKYSIDYPASFMFVASMNPCPCGYYGDPTHKCVCTPGQIQRYMNKISGPLLDRIDLQIERQNVPFSDLSKMAPGEPSEKIRERVIKARQIQEARFKEFKGIHCNAMMTEKMLHEFAEPDTQSLDMLRMAMERLNLSARAYSRILKVARTIADLEGSEPIQSQHIAEAIGYRNLDRGDWAERGV
jgi:magnesium chelatase family protein